MTPKEIRIILEILEIPLTVAASDIKSHKGDLSATISLARPNRAVRARFADYIADKVRDGILNSPQAGTQR